MNESMELVFFCLGVVALGLLAFLVRLLYGAWVNAEQARLDERDGRNDR